jgi:Ni/Fe-hydrogenase subunit HybB-like protein
MKPVDGQTYTPYWMEVAILLGVVAGLVTVYSLIARYFPVYEETIAYQKPSPQVMPLAEEVYAAEA